MKEKYHSQNKYRKNNPEKIKERQKKYREKNKEKLKRDLLIWKQNNKEKVKLAAKNFRINHKEEILQWMSKYRKTPTGKLSRYIQGAKARNITFNLDKEDFINLVNQKCFYCGTADSIGVDRKDSKQGYFLENCVPCCKKCNLFKGTRNYEKFVSMCIAIGTHLAKDR